MATDMNPIADMPSDPPECAALDDTSRTIFVTSITVHGNFAKDPPLNVEGNSGLEIADALCQQLAIEGGLPGCFMAWLSDETTGAGERLSFLGEYSGSFRNSNGLEISSDWATLTSTGPSSAVLYDEKGLNLEVGAVWTNTTITGASSGEHCCDNWTSKSLTNAVVGCLDEPGKGWTNAQIPAICAAGAHIYCVQIQ